MKTTNYLHTAVILSALLVSAACTPKQSILGVEKKNASVPVSGDRSVCEEEKKEIIPQSALEQKSGILSMPQSLAFLVLKNLPLKDKINTGLACKSLNKDTNKHIQTTRIKELYDIYESKEKDYSSFFSKPDAHAIKILANGQDKKARRIKRDFMRRYWQYLSKQNKETRNKILLSLPRSLLLHGHRGNAHMVLCEEQAANFIKIINKSIGLDPESKELGLNPREHFMNNKEFILEATRIAITIKASFVRFAPPWAKVNDREDIMKLAIDKNPLCLKYASKRLKDDVDFVRYAVDKYPKALQFASQRVKEVLSNPEALKHTSQKRER